MARLRFLSRRQNINGKIFGAEESGVGTGVAAKAEQHQWWVERHRGEGIDGNSYRMTGGVAAGRDGDTGAETAERVAEGGGIGAGRGSVVHEACRARAEGQAQQNCTEQRTP